MSDVSILLPAGWQRLPRRDIKNVADFRGLSPDTDRLMRSLSSVVAGYDEDVDVRFAAIMSARVEPFSLAASLTITPLPEEPHSIASLQLQMLAAEPDSKYSRLSLPCGPALVMEETIEAETGQYDDDVDVFTLQYLVPFPASGGAVVTFATPLLSLAEQFKTVFSTMAMTLRFHNV